MRRKYLIAIVMIVGSVWAPALALEPFGPPAAGLNEAQWGVGLDFSHSRTALKLTNGKSTVTGSTSSAIEGWTIKNYTADVATVYIGCGLSNQIEGFARIGYMTTENSTGTFTLNDVNGIPYGSPAKYGGHTGYAFGVGGKATVWEQDDLKLGGIVQFNWEKPNGSAKINHLGLGTGYYSMDLVVMSLQIAAGPTYKIRDDISIYGGPFLQYISGNIKLLGPFPGNTSLQGKHTANIEQQNYFGGFIGFQIELSKDNPLNIEYQHTATDNALAMNMVWKY
jgi:hypothetical protein